MPESIMEKIAKKIYRKIFKPEKPVINIADDYINWLSFANAGMLAPGNLYCVNYAIKNLPSESPIIEIGSFCGLSANIINYYLHKNGKKNKLITADKWLFENAENINSKIGDSTITHKEYREFVKETFIRNIKMFSAHNLPYTIEQLSDDFFKLWEQNASVNDVLARNITLGGKISFAFIDGNHTYEFAKRDFLNTDKFLEKGGFILFDDSSDHSPFECTRLMKEIVENDHYELVIKNPNYLFRKIK